MGSCELLQRAATCIDVELDGRALSLIARYVELVMVWRKKVNLVSVADEEEFIVDHVVDSLTALRFISSGSRVVDVGSGAGLPGVPLKVADPSLAVTLVEARRKRVFFLREVIRRLGLQGVEVLWGRMEPGGGGVVAGRTFDVAVARGVGGVGYVASIAAPVLGAGGGLVLMRGPSGEAEWREEASRLGSLFRLKRIERLRLPVSGKTRVLLLLERL